MSATEPPESTTKEKTRGKRGNRFVGISVKLKKMRCFMGCCHVNWSMNMTFPQILRSSYFLDEHLRQCKHLYVTRNLQTAARRVSITTSNHPTPRHKPPTCGPHYWLVPFRRTLQATLGHDPAVSWSSDMYCLHRACPGNFTVLLSWNCKDWTSIPLNYELRFPVHKHKPPTTTHISSA
jgi:hypothetical protein